MKSALSQLHEYGRQPDLSKSSEQHLSHAILTRAPAQLLANFTVAYHGLSVACCSKAGLLDPCGPKEFTNAPTAAEAARKSLLAKAITANRITTVNEEIRVDHE